MKRSDPVGELVRPPTATVMCACEAPPGLVACRLVAEIGVTEAAATVPKRTVLPPAKVLNPVPVTVTTVPPADGPDVGLMEVTVGAVGGGGIGGVVWVTLKVVDAVTLTMPFLRTMLAM